MRLEDVPGTRWLLTEEIREDAPIRLFCFAGSSGLATGRHHCCTLCGRTRKSPRRACHVV